MITLFAKYILLICVNILCMVSVFLPDNRVINVVRPCINRFPLVLWIPHYTAVWTKFLLVRIKLSSSWLCTKLMNIKKFTFELWVSIKGATAPFSRSDIWVFMPIVPFKSTVSLQRYMRLIHFRWQSYIISMGLLLSSIINFTITFKQAIQICHRWKVKYKYANIK